MDSETKLKDCLVICPIGEEGSPERKRSDQVLKHIIKPIAEKCGYDADRADKIAKPGIITTQIIERLLKDPLVIADLTGRNANVFYELAIRHAVRMPIVQIIAKGEMLPFDVSASRTIRLDSADMDSQESCRIELEQHIRAVEGDALLVDSPVSQTMDVLHYRESTISTEQMFGRILESLDNLPIELLLRLSSFLQPTTTPQFDFGHVFTPSLTMAGWQGSEKSRVSLSIAPQPPDKPRDKEHDGED